MEELHELKKLRKKLGLTQSELAKKANVSQSLIAKTESGNMDPSYTNVKKIFETLSMMDKDTELTAKDIMHTKIIFLKSTDTLKDAIYKMKKWGISQIPVIKNKKVVGFISETLLLDKLIEGSSHSMKVGDIMQASPPILPPSTSQGVIANILQHFPFVLIEDKGELLGIIAKADLLKVMYNR